MRSRRNCLSRGRRPSKGNTFLGRIAAQNLNAYRLLVCAFLYTGENTYWHNEDDGSRERERESITSRALSRLPGP